MLKNLFFFSSIAYAIFLAVLCLINLSGLPEIGFSLGDKIFHFLAYTLLTFLWYSTFIIKFTFKPKKALFYASGLSFLFGIIIEVLQGTVTTFRSFEVYDVIANTIGILITVILILIKKNITIKI